MYLFPATLATKLSRPLDDVGAAWGEAEELHDDPVDAAVNFMPPPRTPDMLLPPGRGDPVASASMAEVMALGALAPPKPIPVAPPAPAQLLPFMCFIFPHLGSLSANLVYPI